MKRILAALSSFALAITVVWGVPSPAHADPSPAPPHELGALAPKQTMVPAIMPTSTALGSADLRQYAVPPGQQGQVGSCVTWAVAYDMMGWYAQKNGANARSFAPMYMYSQINGGVDDGAFVTDGLSLGVNQGVDTQDDYPNGNYDYLTQPTAAQRTNAAKSKFTGYTTLFANGNGNVGAIAQTTIENALSGGQPVAIGFRVRDGFMYYGNNLTVADDDYTSFYWGNHAVLALAYDANGLIIENSWGTDWGDNGYARLSWNVVQHDVLEAYVVTGYSAAASSPVMKLWQPTTSTAVTNLSWAPAAGGASTTVKQLSNTGWQVSSNASWVTPSPTSGFGFVTAGPTSVSTGNLPEILTAQPNTTGAARSATVTFTTTLGSPAASATVTVNQPASGTSPALTLGMSSWSMTSASAASTSTALTSNTTWSASAPSWVGVSPSSGSGNYTVTFTAQANTSASTRSGTVTFTTTSGSPTATWTVTVTQPGAAPADDCGSSTSSYCAWSNLATSISGQIEVAGDRDWFRLSPTVSGVWTFTASRPASNPLSDSVGTLYAA
ncbi:MAG: hypothetical protein FWD74_10900, partial [Actinomycetia bacterium]|nr:hypothetical protein [Actinomycetes bacterium]